jgi:hypothetical protein
LPFVEIQRDDFGLMFAFFFLTILGLFGLQLADEGLGSSIEFVHELSADLGLRGVQSFLEKLGRHFGVFIVPRFYFSQQLTMHRFFYFITKSESFLP